MRCKECKTNRKKKEFYGKIICFKCEYQRKLAIEKTKKKKKFCRICQAELPSQKWVYCGSECSTIGERKQKREYWTMKVA